MIPQPLPTYAQRRQAHLLNSVQAPYTVTARKLSHVAVQVFDAHLVARAVVAAFQGFLEALYFIGVRLILDVFTNAMLDDFVIL